MDDAKTKGVETLLGNPKKAIWAMSVPFIIAMLAQSANNLIDAVWVAGLGSNALAAVGFVFPLFFIQIGIGNGIGIGTSSAIARNIGRDDKRGVDATATQGLCMVIIGGILTGIVLLLLQRPVLELMGAGETMTECLAYSTPIFICAPLFLLNGVMSNILRSEGAAKRAMFTQILAAGLNIVFDPLFIFDYGLGMGIAGAAWATALAVTCSLVLMCYWFFFKKDTYVKIKREDVRFNREISHDILRVGIPASFEMIIISLFTMVINGILVTSPEGTDGIAIFSSTWRLINILMIPLMAIGGAIVPVFATAYGAKRYDKIEEAYFYSIKVCFLLMLVLVAITEVAAEPMVTIFTYSDDTAHLRGSMVDCLRILSLFLPFASWGFVAGGLFQSMGMGLKSLICSTVRNGLQIPSTAITLAVIGTFSSAIWGVTAMETLGSILAGFWSLIVLKKILKRTLVKYDSTA